MNQFDNEVSSTLKEIAERVETPPYLKDRIDKELLRRCPEYRKKIAVIFGGCSPEYSVSLQSAYAVISHTLTSSTRTDGSMPSVLRMPSIPGIKQRMSWMDFMLAPLSRRQRRNQQNRKRISSSFSNF